MKADRPSSWRSASRTLGVARRRDGLSWQAGCGLLVAALLLNGLGLYSTSTALARALEPQPLAEKEEKVVEFDLVEPEVARFVDNDQPNGPVPPDAKRVGEVDSDVERETKAPNRQNKPQDQPKQAQPNEQGEQGEQDMTRGDESLVDAMDGAMSNDGNDASKKAGRPDPLANLGGSTSMLDQTFGRPTPRPPDVEEGSESILDSERHLYSSFFNRMVDRVTEHWRPEKAYTTAKSEGEWTTVIMFRLDEDGEIAKLAVEGKSGVPQLDEEAERAVRAAAPFPNMPKGLVEKRGYFEFRFVFIFTLTGKPRIYRYQN